MFIYTLPIIAAVIGWFTNFLAVKMLFHPRKKVKILFFEIQGVFPKRQQLLAVKIGKLVADDLLSVKEIQAIIKHPKNVAQINQNIERKLEDYLENTFPSKYPVISLFVRKKSKIKIKQEFMNEMNKIAPEMIDQTVANIEASLDIEEIIRQKVAVFSTAQLEKLILDILESEFRFIEFIGAVVGFMVGLIQIGIIHIPF
ncbi:MAG: DUF445 family protein [Bacteroidota bacterium]